MSQDLPQAKPSNNNDRRDLMEKALLELREMRSKLNAIEQAATEPIAVIGMDCRFPGEANSPETFWQRLREGYDAVTEIPPNRWDIEAYYDPDPAAPDKMHTRYGSFLSEVDQFDPQFFGITPREAAAMDPQQRLLLEVGWGALERAGIPVQALRGSKTGVFIGIMNQDYSLLNRQVKEIDLYRATGNAFSFAAGRIAYILGLQGPTLTVDTACSSSLVAVHLACQSLRQKECDLSLVGGVNLILSPGPMLVQSQAQMLSPDGRCKTFAASANGLGRGEGCGGVVLKRLSEARRDGDTILALIRGSAVNHDGPSGGLTIPNELAQEKLLQQALNNAKVAPQQVSYLEAHGTGTPIGDPIEMNALKTVFGRRTPPLIVGSLKTNVGHLEGAAGIAGLIKVILSLHYQEIPPHLHFNEPNPLIPWDDLPVTIPTTKMAWATHKNEPRIAGVSSFGLSGTNAHVVVEETPRDLRLTIDDFGLDTENPKSKIQNPKSYLLPLSAKSEPALRDLAQRYSDFLVSQPKMDLGDVCYTAQVGRSHFRHRLCLMADSREAMQARLTAYAKGQTEPGVIQGDVTGQQHSPKVAFLFTGQGSQYVNMGRDLYETQPTFRAALDRCAEILQNYLDISLLEVLYPDRHKSKIQNPKSKIDETVITQPALFVLEYALAQLWQSWGIKPNVVLGHSVGELVAACVAGVFSLEDGLRLVAERGRLMQSTEPGEMVVVFAAVDQVQIALSQLGIEENVSIAAINGPQNVVISGVPEAIQPAVAWMDEHNFKTQKLTVSHAFHSPLMEPILPAFLAAAGKVSYARPRVHLISNVTGQTAIDEVTTSDYWARHIRQPVRFAESVKQLQALNVDILVEIGPKPTLLGLARQILPEIEAEPEPALSRAWLPSLRPGSEWRQMLQSLAELYVRGAEVNWSAVSAAGEQPRRRVILPTYPWQRQRYWLAEQSDPLALNSIASKTRTASLHPLLGQQLRLAQSKLAQQTHYFESYLSQNSPDYLADHRVFETAILPAAAYLEMALAAGYHVTRPNTLRLEHMALHLPLVLEDEAKPIQLTVTAEDETKFSFQIFSLSEIDDPAWTLHAEGAMVQVDSESWQTSLPVERIEGGQWQNGQTVADRLSGYEEIDVDRFYQTCRERGIDYDRHFRAVQQLWFIPNRPTAEALGRIQLPENVSSAAYTLHPILLDACFQVLGAAFIEPDQETDQTDLYLPVSLDRVQCWRPAGTGLWSHVQVVPRSDPTAQQLKANVNLFDDQGTVATIEGLTVRRVTPAMMLRGQSLKGVTYKITWLETPLPNGGAISSSNKWLIFADRGGTGTALAQRLSDNGDECVLIFAGPVSQQSSDNTYTLNPTRPDAYQPLLARLAAVDPRPYDGVIHLWSLDADQEADETIQKQVELVCSSTLSILQTLVQNGWVTRLWLVTRGAQPVVDDVSHVAQASLWGLGRVIALEHPEFQTICLDLDPSEMPETLPMLARELLNPTAENQVAFRQGDRYIARLVRSHTPATTEPVTLDKDGSYLITGGLGGLGLQIANLLTQNGARHLILAGRSGATGQDQQQAVAKLEQLGCQVLVIRADISRQADVKTLLTQIQAAMPPLKGVIHAAGVLDDGVLQQQNWSRFERVLAPKVQGVWHLHTLTQELPLDFFVCFSSLSSLLGSPGQGNYAAANAFMDALAHQRRARGQSGLAINWGPWAEVGMATAQSSRWAGLGVQALEPEQGAHFLWELLGYDQPQVAVFPVRWSKFREQFGFQVPPLFADLWQTKPIDTAQFEKLKKRLSQRPYEAEEILLAEIQSQLAQVLGLPADEWLDPKQKLFEIGMDSLMALELRNRLQLLVSNTLPATLLFNYPSVEGLVGYLKEEVFAEVIAGAQPPAEEPAVTAPERDELASLSEDDLEAKLLQKIAAVKERKLS